MVGHLGQGRPGYHASVQNPARLVILLLASSLAGCGARSDLDPASAPDGAVAIPAPACKPGDPVTTLAGEMVWPFGIVVDESSVYFTTYANPGAVMKVPKAGGPAVTLASGLDYPDQIAMDATDLYVTVGGSGSILRLAKDGSDTATVVTGIGGPSGIVMDETTLYWCDYFGNRIGKAPKAGGATTVLAGEEAPYRIAAGPTAVYWSSFAADVTWTLKAGGPVATIASGGNPRTLAVHGDRVFWTDSKAQEIHSAGLDGQGAQTLATLGGFADGIAVDDGGVFAAAGGEVVKVPLGGGAVTVLASGQALPTLVAVDDACVYWTNTGDSLTATGAVMRAPR
jgi:hypothetical protein